MLPGISLTSKKIELKCSWCKKIFTVSEEESRNTTPWNAYCSLACEADAREYFLDDAKDWPQEEE